jgi:hypothetical protein
MCFSRWRSTPLSGCSARCGSGELQQQSTCVRTYTSKPDEPASEQECLTASLQRPPDRVPCYTDCFGRKWTYSEWTAVSFP